MSDGWGFAAITGEQGSISQIIRDELDLGLTPDSNIRSAIDPGDREKFQRFLATVLTRHAAFDWVVNVNTTSGIRALHFGGACLDKQLVIIAAENRANLQALSNRLGSEVGSISDRLREVLRESSRQMQMQSARDATIYDDLTRLNNELATTQRSLLKSNVQLTTANEQLHAFYEALPLGVFRTDKAGNLLQANAHFHLLAGAQLQSRWYQSILSDDAGGIEDHWLELLSSPTHFDHHGRFLGADGELRHLQIRVVQLRDDQRLTGFVGVAEDVSLKRRAEQQERALARNHSIRDVSAGLAHNLNNILTVSLSTAEEMLDGLAATDPLHDIVTMNMEATLRASALTRRLMTYSEITLTRDEAVSVNQIVEGLYHLVEDNRRALLHLRLSSEPTIVEVDTGGLTESLNILLENAWLAIKGKEQGRIDLKTEVNEHSVVIEVSDNGVGMDPETLQRAKDPFFTTRGVGEGMGLGLSFADGFARLCDGSLELTSRVGLGTTARLALPF